ncbi:MAG TPA: DUF5977 domain-containing protein, partial [Chitinophagaceae bacterium]|nr:DUF5977 domain-containing protein [Chitinophagaceae bacterium]
SYIVPYGRYASAINLQDANDKAASDMSANGQSHANSKGQCFWHNEEVNQFVFKNDCLPDQGPPVSVMYTIEEGKYKSLVSQEDADAMADADIATLGQEYANTLGTCSCVGVGKKWINGVCETGTMTMVGGYYDNGQWICVYYYVFSDNSTSEYYYTYQSFPCPTGS